MILGVASTWNDAKGFSDYFKLADYLDDKYVILLIGLTDIQLKSLPSRIIGFERTESKLELAYFYSMADVVTSLSYGESFGLTLIEAAACGTPVVAYDNTGQTEIIKDIHGQCVPTGDIYAVSHAIKKICNNKSKSSIVNEKYNIRDSYIKYVSLYENLIKKRND